MADICDVTCANSGETALDAFIRRETMRLEAERRARWRLVRQFAGALVAFNGVPVLILLLIDRWAL